MFRGQCGPKAFLFRPGILLPDQLQHLPSEFLGLRAVRTFSRVAVLQPFGSLWSISLPKSLGLPLDFSARSGAYLLFCVFLAGLSNSRIDWPARNSPRRRIPADVGRAV